MGRYFFINSRDVPVRHVSQKKIKAFQCMGTPQFFPSHETHDVAFRSATPTAFGSLLVYNDKIAHFFL